jgi:hypothetical protein
LNPRRLQDRATGHRRRLLDRGGVDLVTAPPAAIGLGDHRHDLKAGLGQQPL